MTPVKRIVPRPMEHMLSELRTPFLKEGNSGFIAAIAMSSELINIPLHISFSRIGAATTKG